MPRNLQQWQGMAACAACERTLDGIDHTNPEYGAYLRLAHENELQTLFAGL